MTSVKLINHSSSTADWNEYSFDTSLLGKLPNGGTGYNKWLKDW